MIEIITAIILLIVLFLYVGYKTYKVQGGFSPPKASDFFTWGEATSGLVGFSYAASMVSVFVFIPLPGLFYTHGIGGWLFVCLPVIAGTSVLYWFAPKYYSLAKQLGTNNYSPFETIGAAFGSKQLGGVIFILSALFVIPLISMQIVGFGRLLESMLDVNYYLSILTLITLFIIYTLYAGMRGDVETDKWQAIAMLIGLIAVACIAVYIFISQDKSIDPEELNSYLSVPGPEGYFTPETLISIGLIMASLPLVNGHYLMRFMIAKNKTELRRGVVSAPWVIFAFYSLAAIIGIIGIFIEPSLDSGDKLTGILLSKTNEHILGSILSGIVLFSFISASLSSVDSQFISLGAGTARDIFQNMLKYKLNDQKQMLVGRSIMAIVGGAAIIIAFDPPRLVIQLNIMAASGVMLLLPTIIGGVFCPLKYKVTVPFISIGSGIIAFVFFAFTENGREISNWNAGVLATVVSTTTFLISALVFRKK